MASTIIDPQVLDWSILFARFVAAAYLDTTAQAFPGLEKLQNELRLSEENSDNKTETQALLARWNNDIVIAFRGTEGKISDWWTDMQGTLVANNSGKGRVHKGFKSATDSVYRHLVRYIRNHAVPGTRLFVCGHSLGGALALLTASRFSAEPGLPVVRGVFTYGAPRVGDKEFVESYRASEIGERTYMWVASADPVTRVAPFSFEYRHAVSRQLTLDHGAIGVTDLDSKIAIELEQEWLEQFPIIHGLFNAFNTFRNAFLFLDSAQHSATESYIKQLDVVRAA